MGLALKFEITGLANGAPVEVVGSGEFEAGHVRLEISTPRAHMAFDPALVAVGLLDVLALAASLAENRRGSGPGTWVTPVSGHMGDTGW